MRYSERVSIAHLEMKGISVYKCGMFFGAVLLLLVSALCGVIESGYSSPEFVIFVPSYNNEKYAEENLNSLCYQVSTKPYHILCVNDCSTDKTGYIMDEYVQKNGMHSKVTVIHNKERKGMLENIYTVVHSLPDDKVVVCVDGDDLLKDNTVLQRLEKAYSDPDTWLTYGTAYGFPVDITISKRVPDKIFHKKKLRTYRFVTSHLRTFKAGLFKKIKKEDLMYGGSFIPVAGDVALMLHVGNGRP